VDLEDLRLHVLVDVAAQAQVLESLYLVADAGRFLEERRLARRLHLELHLANQATLLPFENEAEAPNLLAVFLLGDAQVARGCALTDAGEDARPEPAPAFVVRIDVEGAGAELEDALEHLEGGPQALGAREGAVELDPFSAWIARELDARI